MHTGQRLAEPTSAGCYLRTLLKLYWRLEFVLGATAREKHGRWEHLDVTHETARRARGESH